MTDHSNQPQAEKPIGSQHLSGTDNPIGMDTQQLVEKVQILIDQQRQFETLSDQYTLGQKEIIGRLDRLEKIADWAELQKESTDQVQAMQTALSLSHRKQLQLEDENSKLNEQLEELSRCESTLRNNLEEYHLQTSNYEKEANDLRSEVARLESQVQKLESSQVVSLPATPSSSDEAKATEAAPPVPSSEAKTASESDLISGGWEEQKMELMRKYGLMMESSGEVEHSTSTVGNETPQQPNVTIEPEPALDHFEVKGLNVSEIENLSADVPSTCEESPSEPATTIHVSEAEQQQTDNQRELERREEIEKALERARISRQRRELEEKIISMQMNMADEQKQQTKKRSFLSRMAQFLKRDDKETQSDSRIDNMVRLVDAIKQKKGNEPTTEYHDPRDQPFAESFVIKNGDELLDDDMQTPGELEPRNESESEAGQSTSDTLTNESSVNDDAKASVADLDEHSSSPLDAEIRVPDPLENRPEDGRPQDESESCSELREDGLDSESDASTQEPDTAQTASKSQADATPKQTAPKSNQRRRKNRKKKRR